MARVETCKLYRGVYDIIHPSISRKNISEYKIVLDEDIAPIRVFYPKKEISLEKVIIYIPGEDINYDFYDSFAKQSNRMIFMLDYPKNNVVKDVLKTVKYIVDELIKCKFIEEDITIMGDFFGGDIILSMGKLLKKDIYINIKKIVLSPKKNDLKSITNTLILSNNEKQTIDNNTNYYLLKDSIYDFVHNIDIVSNENIYRNIINYIDN